MRCWSEIMNRCIITAMSRSSGSFDGAEQLIQLLERCGIRRLTTVTGFRSTNQ